MHRRRRRAGQHSRNATRTGRRGKDGDRAADLGADDAPCGLQQRAEALEIPGFLGSGAEGPLGVETGPSVLLLWARITIWHA